VVVERLHDDDAVPSVAEVVGVSVYGVWWLIGAGWKWKYYGMGWSVFCFLPNQCEGLFII